MLTDIVRQKYYSDIPENDFWKIVRADPTSLQGKRIGKYSKWLFRIYRDMVESVLKKRFVKEDMTKATEYTLPEIIVPTFMENHEYHSFPASTCHYFLVPHR